MARVIMGIGIPGSGKTTVLKPFAEENAYTYISPDDIRAELYGDANDQTDPRAVWETVYLRVAYALHKKETVVIDATFAKAIERRDFIQFVREHEADTVEGVYASVPLDVARERNQSRQRVVPDHALVRMHAMLTKDPPSSEDGFDRVVDIDAVKWLAAS